jgi:[ribosomal protein S5]-alanine N-acetyltransferase
MQTSVLLDSERIYLRKLTLKDAPLMLALLNTPKWIQFIGDRNVKSLLDAEKYLENGILKNYDELGYGFYLVVEKLQKQSIGLCGFVKRPELEHPDMGFAFLPEFIGKGYGYEAAKVCLSYGIEILKFETLSAIINEDNVASIGLIKKLGFSYLKNIIYLNNEVSLYELKV